MRRRRKTFTVVDLAVVASLALLYAVSYKMVFEGEAPGGVELFSPAGQHVEALAEDRVIELEGLLGVTRLEIEGGAARVLSSPCPLKLCVKAGRASRPGAVVACLPNKTGFRLVGEHEGAVDGVAR